MSSLFNGYGAGFWEQFDILSREERRQILFRLYKAHYDVKEPEAEEGEKNFLLEIERILDVGVNFYIQKFSNKKMEKEVVKKKGSLAQSLSFRESYKNNISLKKYDNYLWF